MSNKKLLTIILTILLTTPYILALTVPITNPSPITDDQITNTILTDGTRTRAEITSYFDKKADQVITTFRTEGQKMIDDNFKVLDERMHQLAQQYLIQVTTAIIFSIITGQAIWFFIRRVIMKKEEKRPRYLTLDTEIARQYGLITPEYKNKMQQDDTTIIKPTPQSDKKPSPNPPTMNEIEEMIKQNTKNKDPKEIKKQEREKMREEKKSMKLAMKIAKLKLREEKTLRRIREPINKLQAQLTPQNTPNNPSEPPQNNEILPPKTPEEFR